MTIKPISFTVPGQPVGKARPRVTSHGTFTPTKTKKYEEHVKAIGQTMIMQRPDWRAVCPSKEWLRLDMAVAFGAGRRPDLDNVIKSVMDGLEGVFWANDATVVPSISQVKLGSCAPGVEVTIKFLPGQFVRAKKAPLRRGRNIRRWRTPSADNK